MMKQRLAFNDQLQPPNTLAARGLIARPDCLKMAFRCSMRDVADVQALNTLHQGVEALRDSLRRMEPNAQIELRDVHVSLEAVQTGSIRSKAKPSTPPRRGWGWPLGGSASPENTSNPDDLHARRIMTIEGEVCLPLGDGLDAWARARRKATLAVLAQDLWYDGLQRDPVVRLAISPIVALVRDPEAHRPALLAQWRTSLDELARATGHSAEGFHLQQLDPPGPVQQTPQHLDAVRLNLPLSGHPYDPLPLTSAPGPAHGAGAAPQPDHAAPTHDPDREESP